MNWRCTSSVFAVMFWGMPLGKARDNKRALPFGGFFIIRLFVLATLLGCGRGLDIQPSDFVEIVVEPSSLTLTTSPGVPASGTFRAYGVLRDGESLELDLISWSSTNLSAGSMDEDGVFTSVDTNGGITDIVASHFGLEGSARLKLIYAEDFYVGNLGTEASNTFATAPPEVDENLELLYPLDGVTVPRNLEGLAFQWRDPQNNADSLYRVRLQSEITDISIYTDTQSWISSQSLWTLISASNSKGSVSVTIQAADGMSNVRESPSTELVVNRFDARGSVLYWAADTSGIMRIPMGTTDLSVFWENDGVGGGCVGCHSLADEVDRLVVTHDGADGRFSVLDITDPNSPERMVVPNDQNRMTFKTLSPDGQYVLGVRQNTMTLYGTENGVPIRSWAFDTNVSHPDWSPVSDQIVLVRVTGSALSDMEFAGGEIIRMDINLETLELENEIVLQAADPDINFYYPAWSPDGEWIAYNRASNSAPRKCYAAPDAELWLMRPDGSLDIRLDRANGTGPLQNSYPRWGPLPDDDVLWLAYSSRRNYPPIQNQYPQIWLVGIDPALAAEGEDPSSMPYYLPGQNPDSDNHLPVWWSR